MKKTFFYLLAIAAVVWSCDSTPKFRIEGTITDAEDSVLYLEAMTLNGVDVLDSAELDDDGDFSFSHAAPSSPEFYALRINGRRINLSVDSTETITVNASLPTMDSDYEVSGSDNCTKIKEISAMQREVQRKITAFEKNTSMLPGDITDSVRNVLSAYKKKIMVDYILKDPSKAYAYYAVCQSISDLYGTFLLFNPLNDRTDVKCYAAVATAWDGKYPDAERTRQICNAAVRGMENTSKRVAEIDASKISETGIIEVALPDAGGNVRSLKGLKGKVVLLDFTKYGAPKSDARTRQMRELYNKYSAKGFEIYQVSLDEDIHFWKYASENLPWICVHETDGSATNVYGVSTLPTYFIIDRNNEVVMRSDAVRNLEAEILKLL